MHNKTNKQINEEYIQHQPFKRVGSCKNCHGVCCRYLVFGKRIDTEDKAYPYFEAHGEAVKDKWIPRIEYTVIQAGCKYTENGDCQLFNTKHMPLPCQFFPSTPFDYVWRFLKQMGTPCGFDFVDRETGKPWNMRRFPESWKHKIKLSKVHVCAQNKKTQKCGEKKK